MGVDLGKISTAIRKGDYYACVIYETHLNSIDIQDKGDGVDKQDGETSPLPMKSALVHQARGCF